MREAINRFRPTQWPQLKQVLCLMPGVRVKLTTMYGSGAALLVHPQMPPAVLRLETGELTEITLADDWAAMQRILGT